jgi:hypothetical protein
MDDYPIKIGKMLFTMVDAKKGQERAYNRWYERDHYYGGCMIGEGWFAGSRWIATRELKDLRFPADSPFAEPVDAGSFLSVYWVLDTQIDKTWAGRQVRWLYANGRGFDGRDHVQTGMYDYLGVDYADEDGVPVELALDHRFPGLGVVVVEPAEGVSQDELRAWLTKEAEPALLGTDSVAMVSSWKLPPPPTPEELAAMAPPNPDPNAKPAPGSPGGPPLGAPGGSKDRLVQLAFIEGDPRDVWDAFKAYAKTIDDSGKGKVTFAAPFFKTVVGTDTYLDQL